MSKIYVTKSGDMWDSIAYLQMGSTDYTHLLIDANMSHCHTYIFSAGVELTIPDVEETINSELPPWRR